MSDYLRPAIGLVLNLFFPGLGTLVMRRWGRGAMQLLLFLLGLPLTIVVIGLPMIVVAWLWGLSSSLLDLVLASPYAAAGKGMRFLMIFGAETVGLGVLALLGYAKLLDTNVSSNPENAQLALRALLIGGVSLIAVGALLVLLGVRRARVALAAAPSMEAVSLSAPQR